MSIFSGSQRSIYRALCFVYCLAGGLAVQNCTWPDSCPAYEENSCGEPYTDSAARSRPVGSSQTWNVDDATSVLQISVEVNADGETATLATMAESAPALTPAIHAVGTPPLASISEVFPTSAVSQQPGSFARQLEPLMLVQRLLNLTSRGTVEESMTTLLSVAHGAKASSAPISSITWLVMLGLVLLSFVGACLLVRKQGIDNSGRHSPNAPTPGLQTSRFLVPRGSTHGGQPQRGPFLGSQRNLSTPVPKIVPPVDRQPNRTASSPSRLDRSLYLCDQSVWADFESSLAIPIGQLPSESGCVGEFYVLSGSLQTALLYGSVEFTDNGLRWFGLSVHGSNDLLASCWPTPGSCRIYEGREVEPCASVQICNKAGDVWGTLSPTGQDSYGVYQGDRRVMTIAGDKQVGSLGIFLDNEPLARAGRDRTGEHVEIGVKPPCDPILMLMFVLAVIVLNPDLDGRWD